MKNGKEKVIDLLSKSSIDDFMRKILPDFATIFMLHRMENPDMRLHGHKPDHIKKVLGWLRDNNFNIVPLKELILDFIEHKTIKQRTVCFTIDDGFHDQYSVAGPLFASYDVSVTYFLLTDFIEGKIWPWDDQLKHILINTTKDFIDVETIIPDSENYTFNSLNTDSKIRYLQNKFKSMQNADVYSQVGLLYQTAGVERPGSPPEAYLPMSWEDVNKLIHMGHDVAPHGKTHRIISKLCTNDKKDEILGSFRDLKNNAIRVAPIFGYPTGRLEDICEESLGLISESNEFIGSVSTDPHPVFNTDIGNRLLPRFGLPNTIHDMIQYCTWIECVKYKLRNINS